MSPARDLGARIVAGGWTGGEAGWLLGDSAAGLGSVTGGPRVGPRRRQGPRHLTSAYLQPRSRPPAVHRGAARALSSCVVPLLLRRATVQVRPGCVRVPRTVGPVILVAAASAWRICSQRYAYGSAGPIIVAQRPDHGLLASTRVRDRLLLPARPVSAVADGGGAAVLACGWPGVESRDLFRLCRRGARVGGPPLEPRLERPCGLSRTCAGSSRQDQLSGRGHSTMPGVAWNCWMEPGHIGDRPSTAQRSGGLLRP